LHDWQDNKKHTCAPPVTDMAMPENEMPPFLVNGGYFLHTRHLLDGIFLCESEVSNK